MKPASIPISSLATLAHEGRVYRSFGRLLAVRSGALLAVPVALAAGDFSAVRDGCPVPWYEVLAAVDTPVSTFSAPLSGDELTMTQPALAALFSPHGWTQDFIVLCAGGRPVARVSSPDGVIFCWVPDQD
jgi:hypothetical protein